jgi:hypothetical protein
MVKVVSDQEYDFLQKCKENPNIEPTVSVVGPRENLVQLSLEISETRKEILDENYIKSALNYDVSSEVIQDSKIVAAAVKNIATEFNKKNIGHLIVLEIKNSFNKIYTASYLVINEINTVFSTVSDEDLSKLEKLFIDTELYFEYIKKFLKSYDDFLQIKEPKLLVRQANIIETQARFVSNIICKIILDIKEYDQNIVERELYKEFYSKEFCPDTFKELNVDAQNSGIFSMITEKFKNFVTNVKTTSVNIQQAFKKTVNHPLYKVVGYLTRHYTLLYISYTIIFNITPSAITQIYSGNFGFVDICIALSTAMCRSFSDPFILGQFIKFFLSFIMSAIPMVNLSSKLRDVSGVIVGNAVTFLGPVMLYSWVKNVLAFVLSVCCNSWEFASTTSLEIYRYSSVTVKGIIEKFNESVQKNPNEPLLVLKEWTTSLGADGASEISRLFLQMFPMGQNLTSWIFSPVTTIFSSVTSKVSNIFSFGDNGEILKIADKTPTEILSLTMAESLQENDNRVAIYSAVLRSTKECILKGTDIIGNYISVIVATLLENKSISSCIDRFKSLYDTSYYYLQWTLFVKASFVETSEILFFNSDKSLINELNKLNIDLQQNVKFLKEKDNIRGKLFELQKDFFEEPIKKQRLDKELPFSLQFEDKPIQKPFQLKIAPQNNLEFKEEPENVEEIEFEEPGNVVEKLKFKEEPMDIDNKPNRKRRVEEIDFEGPQEKIDFKNIKFES